MHFYFPDSQDQIDPSFDFQTELRSPHRIRQRDDYYAHEVLDPVPYQGLLVSKAIIDGVGGGAGRYSAQQRQRLYRVGIREFFRLDDAPGERIATLGDCGAFSYAREPEPPYTVDEVIDFYEGCGFDAGLSLDHVVLGFFTDTTDEKVRSEFRDRQALTLRLAERFLERHRARGSTFEPVGVAQGWSAESYAAAVERLQDLGYERIALGGLVPLKNPELRSVVQAVGEVRAPQVELHLLGVTRCEHLDEFASHGVTSFDSTSAFRQAFKDDRDNYYTIDRAWVALRIPQIEGNVKLMRRIRAGEVDQILARQREQAALQALEDFDRGATNADRVVRALRAYEEIHDPDRDHSDRYREVIDASPWRDCDCAVCTEAGVHAIVFRGTERNKRRGFHNLHIFAQRLERAIDRVPA